MTKSLLSALYAHKRVLFGCSEAVNSKHSQVNRFIREDCTVTRLLL